MGTLHTPTCIHRPLLLFKREALVKKHTLRFLTRPFDILIHLICWEGCKVARSCGLVNLVVSNNCVSSGIDNGKNYYVSACMGAKALEDERKSMVV